MIYDFIVDTINNGILNSFKYLNESLIFFNKAKSNADEFFLLFEKSSLLSSSSSSNINDNINNYTDKRFLFIIENFIFNGIKNYELSSVSDDDTKYLFNNDFLKNENYPKGPRDYIKNLLFKEYNIKENNNFILSKLFFKKNDDDNNNNNLNMHIEKISSLEKMFCDIPKTAISFIFEIIDIYLNKIKKSIENIELIKKKFEKNILENPIDENNIDNIDLLLFSLGSFLDKLNCYPFFDLNNIIHLNLLNKINNNEYYNNKIIFNSINDDSNIVYPVKNYPIYTIGNFYSKKLLNIIKNYFDITYDERMFEIKEISEYKNPIMFLSSKDLISLGYTKNFSFKEKNNIIFCSSKPSRYIDFFFELKSNFLKIDEIINKYENGIFNDQMDNYYPRIRSEIISNKKLKKNILYIPHLSSSS